MRGAAVVIRGDARNLPLPDASVDLICTSPPYFNLRSYSDGGEHYDAQLGSETTPREFTEALLACTKEWMRVLKPDGSIFVNLGDTYSSWQGERKHHPRDLTGERASRGEGGGNLRSAPSVWRVPAKSLIGIPWRYALGCIDELGLTLRRDIIWHKKNGIPESVGDRFRTAHEYIFHLVKQQKYFTAVDEIREDHKPESYTRFAPGQQQAGLSRRSDYGGQPAHTFSLENSLHPLGRLPGSVWEFPLQPLIGPQCRLVWDGRTIRWFPTWAEGEKHLRMLAREWWAWPVGSGRPSLRPEGAHYACVDADTEILTRRGWLRHDEVQAGEECAGYDLDAGLARWTIIHSIHTYPFDGELVAVDKPNLSMRLTPNHRTIVARKGREEIVRADEVRPTDAIPRAAAWETEDHREVIGTAVAALCGWVAAEGWYQPTGNVHLSQSATANPDKVAEIDKLIASVPHVQRNAGDRGISFERGKYRARLISNGRRVMDSKFATRAEAAAALTAERERLGVDGLRRTENIRTWKGREWVDVMWRLPRGLGDHIRRLMPDKKLTADLANLPLAEARALFEAFVNGDGHQRSNGLSAAGRISIYQKHRENLDWLQMIAVRLGYRTIITQENDRYVLYCNEALRPLTLRGTNGTIKPIPREHYRGIVWCPTTGTGTMIARRNGRVFITGQSFPMELPRRIIKGFSPDGICMACGEGRRPVGAITSTEAGGSLDRVIPLSRDLVHGRDGRGGQRLVRTRGITGYACACTPYTDHPGAGRRYAGVTHSGGARGANTGSVGYHIGDDVGGGPADRTGPWREYHFGQWEPPPTRPAVVLDPFGGTGCTAMVAAANGRIGITVDYSHTYSRFARWRTGDASERAKAMQVRKPPPPPDARQESLFDMEEL